MTGTDAPCMVFLAAVQYCSCISGRTRHFAVGMAQSGCRVCFVNMPGLRYTAKRLVGALQYPELPVGLQVLDVLPAPMLPMLHASMPGRMWSEYAARRIRRQLGDPENTVLIVSTPWWIPVLRRLEYKSICYDCIDHINVHAPTRWRELYSEWDRELVGMAGCILTVSSDLEREMRRQAPGKKVARIPNAVSLEWTEQTYAPVTREHMGIDPGVPVVGFLGALFEWLDIELLVQAARCIPDAVFVMVGPQRFGVDLSSLEEEPNVRIFGAQPFKDVPRWISAFDVCLIPFKDDVVSRAADPIKLYEYLALGKPVVASLVFGGDDAPILVGEDAPRFCACIRKALAGEGPTAGECRAYARQHTWQARVARIMETLGK